MPKLDSTRYTLLFATAVSVVCALLVATAAVGLRERQEINAQLYKQKNVLLAASLVPSGQDRLTTGAAKSTARTALMTA